MSSADGPVPRQKKRQLEVGGANRLTTTFSRLEALQADLFEQAPVVGDRTAAFVVVIGDIGRVVTTHGVESSSSPAAQRAPPGNALSGTSLLRGRVSKHQEVTFVRADDSLMGNRGIEGDELPTMPNGERE